MDMIIIIKALNKVMYKNQSHNITTLTTCETVRISYKSTRRSIVKNAFFPQKPRNQSHHLEQINVSITFALHFLLHTCILFTFALINCSRNIVYLEHNAPWKHAVLFIMRHKKYDIFYVKQVGVIIHSVICRSQGAFFIPYSFNIENLSFLNHMQFFF